MVCNRNREMHLSGMHTSMIIPEVTNTEEVTEETTEVDTEVTEEETEKKIKINSRMRNQRLKTKEPQTKGKMETRKRNRRVL